MKVLYMHELLDSRPTLPTQGKSTLPEKADVTREKYKLENYTWYGNKGEERKSYLHLFVSIQCVVPRLLFH